MDDMDLSGLDLAGAKAYILDLATNAKTIAKDIAELKTELDTWRGRVSLAEGRGLSDLAEAARLRSGEIEGKIASLEAEKNDLEAEVARTRGLLPTIAARERSIDADRLLAELQLMTGELLGPAGSETPAGAEAELQKLETKTKLDLDLEALKKKIGGQA